MKLSEMIAGIKPYVREDAKNLLKSDRFHSLKQMDDGDSYEALIYFESGLLMPEVMMDSEQNILGKECQCANIGVHEICVHLTATLLGIEKMLLAGSDDYHEAVKILEQS